MQTGRRVHERFTCDLDVTVLHGGSEHAGRATNISLGGMFLQIDAQLPLGTEVTVRFRIPELKSDTVHTTSVRWNKPDGIGVQFGSLRAIEVWGLNQLFKTLSPSAE